MYSLGIDIGTTTLSAVVVDIGSGEVKQKLTIENAEEIPAEDWARLQDPEGIWNKANDMMCRLLDLYPNICCIGLAGQMHGILYTDAEGRSVSPLYTWQDGRGDILRADGKTYAQSLSAETGRNLATGYGAVTHSYNLENDLVPQNAKWAMTIHDYVGMKLTGRREPLSHVSNTESFGAPDWAGISSMIRTTDKTECIGTTNDGIPVAVAIGDNQASFIGSVKDAANSVLINMGTGGQISMASGRRPADGGRSAAGGRSAPSADFEARPYIDSETLLVGFSLCGGQAYALLEKFFREAAVLAGAPSGRLYEQMNALAEIPVNDPLNVSTLFSGTRRSPELKGSITGISDRNFTPAHLVQGVLKGMVDELLAHYPKMCERAGRKPKFLIGSGNAIRMNPALRKLFEEAFNMPMQIPAHQEEAAYGAALFAQKVRPL